MTKDHPLQKLLWDLEWQIHHAHEMLDRADDAALKAQERVNELEQEFKEILESLDVS